jgi:hypothetical protein
MRKRSIVWMMGLLIGALHPSAFAKTVLVPPLVARNVGAETVLSMTTLLASDLTFVGDFDDVTQLDKRPSGWGSSCIGSRSCLAGLVRKNGAQALVSGSVSRRGSQYELKLVYFDGGKIIRTKTTRFDKEPMAVADGLASHMRLVVTGENPDAQAQDAMVVGFEGGGVDFLDEEEESDLAITAPSISRRIQTPPGQGRRVQELEDPDEGGGYAPVPPPRPVARAPVRPPPPARIDDVDDIQFGSATDDIQVEDITFGSATSLIELDEPAPAPQPAPRTVYRPIERYEDPVEDGGGRYADLDEPDPAPRPVRQQASRERSSRRAQTSQNSTAGTLGLTGRAGYSKFQSLNFLTYGIEGAFQLQDTLALVAGLEAYSVRRALDPTEVPVGQPAVVWNTILPFNLGMLYKPSSSDIRPYVGVGAQIIPGYIKSEGATAYGFRARGGVDYILTDNFGLNLNVAAGMWSGEHFSQVQDDLQPVGMVPQISGGTILLF